MPPGLDGAVADLNAAVVNVDPVKIDQVVRNLISNAVSTHVFRLILQFIEWIDAK